MGGMLENMIRGVMERKIGEEYPQAQLPPVMLAQVSAVSESGNIKEEHRQVQVELEDGPRTVETVIRKKVMCIPSASSAGTGSRTAGIP